MCSEVRRVVGRWEGHLLPEHGAAACTTEQSGREDGGNGEQCEDSYLPPPRGRLPATVGVERAALRAPGLGVPSPLAWRQEHVWELLVERKPPNSMKGELFKAGLLCGKSGLKAQRKTK